MKTFFEYFLNEVLRKLEKGEIDGEKAKKWIEETKVRLEKAAKIEPRHPAVQMPVGH